MNIFADTAKKTATKYVEAFYDVIERTIAEFPHSFSLGMRLASRVRTG
jgi:hypothetical protein